MDSTKKTTQKTSGTHKSYKQGQLITINNCVFRIVKGYICINDNCFCCFSRNFERYKFCVELPLGLRIEPILKHKG